MDFNCADLTSKRAEKGNSIIEFPQSYCMIDLETTGYSPLWDEIIEVAAIKYFDGKETARFHTLVKPSWDVIPDFIIQLTGIINEMLIDAPRIDTVITQFDEFLGDSIIMGYNVTFDVNFLYDAYITHLGKPLRNDHVDCMRIARRLHPEMEHHRLCDVAAKLNVVNDKAHRAMSDAEATQTCYLLLKNEALV